ncbi:MAG: response regulator [Chitinivibrionales bacterium]|nr:response regulator [Chitinivibrionales bacterium]
MNGKQPENVVLTGIEEPKPATGCALVIDDEEAIREYLRYVLQSEGYEVTTASDGNEGMRKFHAGGYDTVVTDISMPEKDGIEAIIEMRRLYPAVPIVAISGLDSRERLLRIAGMFEADAMLKKPFTRDELLAAVREARQKRISE